MTRRYPYVTVDVFTDTRFGGNPLAVFTDARGLTDRQMQQLAAEMNYSETTFVLPPEDPANTARVRIFNRTQEMPFAGHPNVGTGSANAALAALLLSLGGGDEARFQIAQGVEMGRPSLLLAQARRTAGGIRATVGGGCVQVLRGEAILD